MALREVDASMPAVTFGKRKTPPPDADPAFLEPPAIYDEPAPAAPPQAASHATHYFMQQSNPISLGMLERDIADSIKAGAGEITIVLSSPGGMLLPMLEVYRRLISLPVKIKTYAIGPVASAGTILLLAGEERTADPSATFLFHPVSVPGHSRVESYQGLRIERQRLLFEMTLHNVYKDRTRLSEATIASFGREELIFNCQMAIEHGIIDRVEAREAMKFSKPPI